MVEAGSEGRADAPPPLALANGKRRRACVYVHVRVESTLLSALTTREVRVAEGWGWWYVPGGWWVCRMGLIWDWCCFAQTGWGLSQASPIAGWRFRGDNCFTSAPTCHVRLCRHTPSHFMPMSRLCFYVAWASPYGRVGPGFLVERSLRVTALLGPPCSVRPAVTTPWTWPTIMERAVEGGE